MRKLKWYQGPVSEFNGPVQHEGMCCNHGVCCNS